MNKSNKAIGTTFEREVAEQLYKAGYWVHLLQQSIAGQPADIIAVGRGSAELIDAKTVHSKNGFAFIRVEPNQHTAMTMWEQRTGNHAMLVLKYSEDRDEILVLPYYLIEYYSKESSYLSLEKAKRDLIPFYKWIKARKGDIS